jgi:hypothetical protein
VSARWRTDPSLGSFCVTAEAATYKPDAARISNLKAPRR